jgi:hypothetical protein
MFCLMLLIKPRSLVEASLLTWLFVPLECEYFSRPVMLNLILFICDFLQENYITYH